MCFISRKLKTEKNHYEICDLKINQGFKYKSSKNREEDKQRETEQHE